MKTFLHNAQARHAKRKYEKQWVFQQRVKLGREMRKMDKERGVESDKKQEKKENVGKIERRERGLQKLHKTSVEKRILAEEEKEKKRAEKEQKKRLRAKERSLMTRCTPKGQLLMRGVAKLQLEKVKMSLGANNNKTKM